MLALTLLDCATGCLGLVFPVLLPGWLPGCLDLRELDFVALLPVWGMELPGWNLKLPGWNLKLPGWKSRMPGWKSVAPACGPFRE